MNYNICQIPTNKISHKQSIMAHNCNRGLIVASLKQKTPNQISNQIYMNNNHTNKNKKINYENYYEIQSTYNQYCYFIGRKHKSNRQTRRLFFHKYSRIKYTIFSCLDCTDVRCNNKIIYLSHENKNIIKWPHIYKDFPFQKCLIIRIENLIKKALIQNIIY